MTNYADKNTRSLPRPSTWTRFLLAVLLGVFGSASNATAGTYFIGGPNADYWSIHDAVNALVPFQADHVFYVAVPLAGYNTPMDLTTASFNGHTLIVYGIEDFQRNTTYYVDDEIEYRVGNEGQLWESIENTDGGQVMGRKVKTPWSDGQANEFLIQNNQGSTVTIVDDVGEPMGLYIDYFAYGAQWQEAITPIARITQTYTGKELDALGEPRYGDGYGLYHFGARYYDADIGLWMGVDPEFETNNPYTFAANNPMTFTDANGRSVYTKAGKVIWKVIKTGDAAAAFADNINDAVTLFSANATLGERALAGISLASEFLPVSVGDIKDGLKVAAAVEKRLEKAKSTTKFVAKAETKVADAASTAGKKIPNHELLEAPGKRGSAPIGSDGHPVELHHRGQKADSPLDEMTRTDHRGKGNFKKNHSNTGQHPSEIDRVEWNKERKEYWSKEWDSGRFDDHQ